MPNMDEPPSTSRSLSFEECAVDLISKGYLTQEKWIELAGGDRATAEDTIRHLIDDQLKQSVQLALSKQPTDQVLHSDIIAAAAGGLWGAASAWLKTTPILNPPPAPARAATDPSTATPRSSTFLWNTAKEAALRSMETSRKIRTVDFVELKRYCGDELASDHVVIAINGFMTHGYKPSVNWEAIGRKRNVAGFVLLWEAGNAAEWDAFCNETSVHLETGQEDTIVSHFTVGNPWNKAQNKAHQVGIVLAELLISQPVLTRGRKVTLVGHSLGSAVIHSCLQHMASHNSNSNNAPVHLHQAVFFAGAFVPDHDFAAIADTVFQPNAAVASRLLNVFSAQDHILMHLFSLVNIHITRPAAGCAAIQSKNVRNIDVTDIIPSTHESILGHSYEKFMDAIVDRLGTILDLPSKFVGQQDDA